MKKNENNFNKLEDTIAVMDIILNNANQSDCLNNLQTFIPTNECCKETFKTHIESSNVFQTALDTKCENYGTKRDNLE